MFRRLLILNGILLVGYASIALLPETPPIQQASVVMELPPEVGSWEGVPVPPSEAELELLSDDTEFEKRLYASSTPTTFFEQLQTVSAGIVLSGHDMNNSIHRPERCLPSQGFEDLHLSTVQVPVGSETIPVRRIRSHRDFLTRDGQTVRLTNVNYFWFVGHGHYTESHYERTFLDMADRLFNGYNQRWAYFTISGFVTDTIDPIVGRSETETDERLARFIEEIYKDCVTLPAVAG